MEPFLDKSKQKGKKFSVCVCERSAKFKPMTKLEKDNLRESHKYSPSDMYNFVFLQYFIV